MCEFQQKVAYPQGIINSLENSILDFQKLMNRFQIQDDFS